MPATTIVEIPFVVIFAFLVLDFLSLSDSAFLVLASRRYMSGRRRVQGVAENWCSTIRALSFLLLFLFLCTQKQYRRSRLSRLPHKANSRASFLSVNFNWV
jgi:hypothetical protein